MNNEWLFEDENLKEKEKSLIEIRKIIREEEKIQTLFGMLRLFLLNKKKQKLEEEIKETKKKKKRI